MVKIFAIGATGYVGSDAAAHIAHTQPSHTWTLLVRSPSKTALASTYLPADKTHFVTGDFDSYDIIAAEAEAADIVINWGSCDHVPLMRAILAGMKRRKARAPSFLIHTSGAALLEWEDMAAGTYGRDRAKVYDDWDGVGEVTAFPDEALHRPVDRLVLAAGEESGGSIRTAIVCPPCIYGRSRVEGVPEHSMLALAVDAVLKRGKGFRVGEGRARWNTVHVRDLSEVFTRLVEEAAKGGGTATWGPGGYYFVESGEIAWGEFITQIARVAAKKGFIQSAEVDSLDAEEAKKVHPLALVLWGYNSRAKAVRARKVLGWNPAMAGMLEEAIQNWRWSPGTDVAKLDLPKGTEELLANA